MSTRPKTLLIGIVTAVVLAPVVGAVGASPAIQNAIAPPPGGGAGNFQVLSLDAPENATTRNPVKVRATIANDGDGRAKQTVELRVDGDVVASRPVNLGADQRRTVQFTLRTRDLSTGEHTYGVYTANDSATATINVTEGDRGGGDDPGEGGPGGPGGDLPANASSFTETTPLGPDQTDPNSLSGKIRVEEQFASNTTINLTRETESNYTLAIEVTGNATNVTFYLQKQAVAASQNISNVTAYLDGEQFNFTVKQVRGQWIVFVVDHFSTRYVTFTEGDADGGGGGAVSVPDAIAGRDDRIQLGELQSAIGYWQRGETVPGTNGETIDLAELQELIELWQRGERV